GRARGMSMRLGQVIFLNGTSSAGKSSLAKALQQLLDEPYLHIASDHFLAAGMLPVAKLEEGRLAWSELQAPFHSGINRSIAGFAAAGNNLIVDYYFHAERLAELVELLAPFDVFSVHVFCSRVELERREAQRPDRTAGAAKSQIGEGSYPHDLELDTTD